MAAHSPKKIYFRFSENKPFGIESLMGLIVQEAQDENGDLSIVVAIPEDSPMDKLKDEFAQTGKLHFPSSQKKDQLATEFARYKQDCRKRALEVAERTVTQSLGGQISDAITTEADKYYNWLISIPNDK